MVFATNAAHELDSLGEGVASLPPFASHGSIAAHWRAICQVHWDRVFRVGVQEAKTSSARRCRPTTCSSARAYKSTKSVLSLSLILARLPAISHRARVNPSDGEERASERPFHARQVQSIRIICLPLTATFLQMYSVKCACSAERHTTGAIARI
jgi:hypothetical protein